MGIYTSNRYFGEAYDYAAEIPANEAYDAAFGCAHILADCQANDMALFESSIYSDMQEVMAVREGYQVVNENAFSNVIKKIVEMFKKLLAKIKGIFNAFLAKLAGAFKNGKDLVKKYEKQIIKYSNWKDLKIKGIRKPKNGNDIINAVNSVFNFELSSNYTISTSSLDPNETDKILNTGIPGFETAKKIKDGESEDLKLAIMKKSYIKNATISDYKDAESDIKDYLYDDEDTLDGEDDIKTASFFSQNWIKTVLADEKWEKDVQKDADKMDKVINKIIDDLNKTDDNLAKFIKDNEGKGKFAKLQGTSFGTAGKIDKDTSVSSKAVDVTDDGNTYGNTAATDKANEALQVAIHGLQTLASNEQEVITKVTSLYMENIKFATAQARKIWTAAAAWSSTTHKESVEYYQALGEAAAEQFYMNMEAIGA